MLQVTHGGSIAPEWALGAWIGAGGFAGSYLGARLQRRLPEASTELLARATDRAGATQPDTVPFNAGGYEFWAVVRHPITAVA